MAVDDESRSGGRGNSDWDVRDLQPHAGGALRGDHLGALAAARRLFAAQGYAGTSLDAIAAEAGVTKGALYHHFDGKRDVFRAVYAAEQERRTEIESAAYARKRDPWEGFHAACLAFLEASMDPGVQRITLLDAPGALGWETMRQIESDSLAMTQKGLRRAMDAGWIPRRPVEPLAQLLFGALCEAAMAIARADNQKGRATGDGERAAAAPRRPGPVRGIAGWADSQCR